jgi:hypothetical protein
LLLFAQKLVNFALMAINQEELENGIATILKEPDRNFQTHPLSQSEVTSIIEFLVNEVNDESTSETLAEFYLSVISFLKKQVLYN